MINSNKNLSFSVPRKDKICLKYEKKRIYFKSILKFSTKN